MNERLHKMIRFGILQRTGFGEKPPVEVEYRLTKLRNRFVAIIDQVRRLQGGRRPSGCADWRGDRAEWALICKAAPKCPIARPLSRTLQRYPQTALFVAY